MRGTFGRRSIMVAAVTVAFGVAFLMAADTASAQHAKRVSQLKLDLESASKLTRSDDWRKTVAVSGDTIRPQKGLQMFQIGDIILITNDDVTSPPPYQTLKDAHVGGIQRRGGTCSVVRSICACASTLIDNMYGGNANDDCRFNGDANASSCQGAAGCCAFFSSTEEVVCPEDVGRP